MVSFKRWVSWSVLSVTLLLQSGLVRADLDTKEEQYAALVSIIAELKTHYGLVKFKKETYGLDLDELQEKYARLVRTATTLEEDAGYWPKIEREILPPDEFRQLMIGLVAELRDGHANIQRNARDYWTIGLRTAAINGKLYVTGFRPDFFDPTRSPVKIETGDEIVEINGRPIAETARENLLYSQTATFEGRYHQALEFVLNVPHSRLRSKHMGETVKVKFSRPDPADNTKDKTFEATYYWVNVAELNDLNLLMGEVNPKYQEPEEKLPFAYGQRDRKSYFSEGLLKLGFKKGEIVDIGEAVNADFRAEKAKKAEQKKVEGNEKDESSDKRRRRSMGDAYDLPEGIPSKEAFRRTGEDESKGAEKEEVTRLRAYTVRYKGKNFGVIRIPNYVPDSYFDIENEFAWLLEVVSRFENTTDGLVIDQLSNGGGYVDAVTSFLKLFTKDGYLDGQTIDAKLSKTFLDSQELGQKYHRYFYPDDKRNFARIRLGEEILKRLKEKYAKGERWSGPMPAMSTVQDLPGTLGKIVSNPGQEVYTKPILLLNDNRSASGGDFFPSILQANKRALVYGEVSMALGAPVSRSQDSMPGSEMWMRCPYGMCWRSDGLPIEGAGVVPDVYRRVTRVDLMDGFKSYAEHSLNALYLLTEGKTAEEIEKAYRDPIQPKDAASKEAVKADAPEKKPDEKKPEVTPEQAAIDALNAALRELETVPDAQTRWALLTNRYEMFFDELRRIMDGDSKKAWAALSVPLPKEVLLSDVVLASAVSREGWVERLNELVRVSKVYQAEEGRDLIKTLASGIALLGDFKIRPLRCSEFLAK